MRRSSKSWRPSAERRRQHSEATASPGRPRTLAGTHGKCIPRPNPFRNRESSFNPRNRASCSCPVPTTNSIPVNADPARANHGGVDPQRKIGLARFHPHSPNTRAAARILAWRWRSRFGGKQRERFRAQFFVPRAPPGPGSRVPAGRIRKGMRRAAHCTAGRTWWNWKTRKI